MRLWMVDMRRGSDDKREREYALVIAENRTAVNESIEANTEDVEIEDAFEVDIYDSRWSGLVLVGQLKHPERF